MRRTADGASRNTGKTSLNAVAFFFTGQKYSIIVKYEIKQTSHI